MIALDLCRPQKISNLNLTICQSDQSVLQCSECKKNYKKEFNKELIKRFANTYEFCNGDINKFVSLLRKGVYPYEYVVDLMKQHY